MGIRIGAPRESCCCALPAVGISMGRANSHAMAIHTADLGMGVRSQSAQRKVDPTPWTDWISVVGCYPIAGNGRMDRSYRIATARHPYQEVPAVDCLGCSYRWDLGAARQPGCVPIVGTSRSGLIPKRTHDVARQYRKQHDRESQHRQRDDPEFQLGHLDHSGHITHGVGHVCERETFAD